MDMCTGQAVVLLCCRRHGPLHHYCWWNKHVANPIKKWGYAGKGRKAMQLLKRDILTRILLRRTKVQCADVLALPPRCGLGTSSCWQTQERCHAHALLLEHNVRFAAACTQVGRSYGRLYGTLHDDRAVLLGRRWSAVAPSED